MSPNNGERARRGDSRRVRLTAGQGKRPHREHAVPEISVHPAADEESARLAEWNKYATHFGVAPDHPSGSTAPGQETLNLRSGAELYGLEGPSRRGRRHAYAEDGRSNTTHHSTRSTIREVGDPYDPEGLPGYAQSANFSPTAHLRTPSGVPADSDFEVREIDSNGRPIGSRLPAARRRSISTDHRPSEEQGKASVHFRPRSKDARPRRSSETHPRFSPALTAHLDDIHAQSARRARSRQRRGQDKLSPFSESSETRYVHIDEPGPSARRHGSSRRPVTYVVDEQGRHDLADSDDSTSIRPRRMESPRDADRRLKNELFGKDGYSARVNLEEEDVYHVPRGSTRRTSGTAPAERLPSQPRRSSSHREYHSSSHKIQASPSVSPARDYYSGSWSKRTRHRGRSSPPPDRHSPSKMDSYLSDKTRYPRGRRPRSPPPDDRPSHRRVSESRGAQDTRGSSGRRPTLTSYRSSSVPNPERYDQEGSQPSRQRSPAHQARPRTSRRMSKSEDDLPRGYGSQRRRSKSIRSTISDNKGKIIAVAAVAGVTALTAINVAVTTAMDGGTRVGNFVFGSKRSHKRPMDTRSVKSDSNGYHRRRPSDVRESSPYARPPSGVRWHRRSGWSPRPARRHEDPEFSRPWKPRSGLYEFDGFESPDPLDSHRSRASSRDDRFRGRPSRRSLVGTPPPKYLQYPPEYRDYHSPGSVDDSMADEEGDPSTLSEEGDHDPATTSHAAQRYTPGWARLAGPSSAGGQGSGSPSQTHLEASRALVRYNPRDRNRQHPSSQSPSPGPSTRGRQARTRSQSTQTEAGQYMATPYGPADYPFEGFWDWSRQESPMPD